MTATNGTTSARYGYDPFGRRVSKTVNGTTTYYALDAAGDEIGEISGGQLQRFYVYDDAGTAPVAMIAGSGAVTYNHTGRIGSVIATTSNNAISQILCGWYRDERRRLFVRRNEGFCVLVRFNNVQPGIEFCPASLEEWLERCRKRRLWRGIKMDQYLKIVRTPVKYGFIAVILMGAPVFYWLHTHPFIRCNRVETLLDRDVTGRSVFYIRTFCDGVASSDTESFDLAFPSGDRTTILKFDYPDHSKNKEDFEAISVESSHQPKVTWTDAHTLKVEIGVVGKIQSELENAGGVHVVFDLHRIVTE